MPLLLHSQALSNITACSAVSKQTLLELLHHYAQVGAKVLFDCCQSVPCRPTDVQQLGADWIVGAGHKMCGPTGSAFLWGKYVSYLQCTAGSLFSGLPPQEATVMIAEKRKLSFFS